MTILLKRLLGSFTLAIALILCGPAFAQTPGLSTGRVIMQFKPGAPLADKRIQAADRVTTLSQRLGMALSMQSGPAPEMHLVSAPGVSADALAEALSNQSDVLYAVPDRIKQIRAIPNDPRYAEQWPLQTIQPAAINAEGAWDVTTGTADVTVAVIDTGARFEHEDLVDRFLPGYDFITDPQIAADGNGRDADATDPGDFLTTQHLQGVFFQGCGGGPDGDQPTNSSWHGTRVAGVIAASGNNSRGVAGVSWNARILPLRVLGKCGGFDSDVLAAMRWGGGLSVPGVPENPTPAKILNLSLGGNGGCSAPYLETIAELKQRGVAVVVAAGNSSVGVEEPGNCPGVITVGGLRHDGTKVGFSSHGPQVKVSAPAGNCVNTGAGQPCLFQIATTTNLGATTPGADGYSDGFNPSLGTSFSTPLASGTLALMLSVHPGLGSDALMQRLQSSARTFPVAPGLPFCPQNDPISAQCNCTTESCGAGMLDANGAVAAAFEPQAQARSSEADGRVTLDGSTSSASIGRSLVAWQWQQTGGPFPIAFAQAQSAVTELHAPIPGDYWLALTVTDSTGKTDRSDFMVTVAEPSVLDPVPEPDPEPDPEDLPKSPRGGGGGGAVDPAALVALLLLAAAAYAIRRRTSLRKAVAHKPPR